MLNFKAILIAWVIGTVAAIGAYHNFSQEQLLELVALTNGTAISDMPDGKRVMVTGTLDVPYLDRLPLRRNESYQCHEESYRVQNSRSSSSETQWRTICDWLRGDRFSPPFALRENARRTPVQITNSDYQMQGTQRIVPTSTTSRMVGWEKGDTLLVIGVTEYEHAWLRRRAAGVDAVRIEPHAVTRDWFAFRKVCHRVF